MNVKNVGQISSVVRKNVDGLIGKLAVGNGAGSVKSFEIIKDNKIYGKIIDVIVGDGVVLEKGKSRISFDLATGDVKDFTKPWYKSKKKVLESFELLINYAKDNLDKIDKIERAVV